MIGIPLISITTYYDDLNGLLLIIENLLLVLYFFTCSVDMAARNTTVMVSEMLLVESVMIWTERTKTITK